ncbi:hypothetical protein SHKM778_67820 [Streptomyces sp. KM77-8]|uniref:Uncharacterized protein n=1 Tax=Streptomyces haneummycinicus TaxID=3074435 RepID=A0AAT9HSF5_9ACTN
MTAVSTIAEPRRRPEAVAPGERGAISIADRVVAKIASQAAREAAGPPAGRRPTARDRDRQP